MLNESPTLMQTPEDLHNQEAVLQRFEAVLNKKKPDAAGIGPVRWTVVPTPDDTAPIDAWLLALSLADPCAPPEVRGMIEVKVRPNVQLNERDDPPGDVRILTAAPEGLKIHASKIEKLAQLHERSGLPVLLLHQLRCGLYMVPVTRNALSRWRDIMHSNRDDPRYRYDIGCRIREGGPASDRQSPVYIPVGELKKWCDGLPEGLADSSNHARRALA